MTRDQLLSIFIDNEIAESAWDQLLDLFLWYGVLGFKKPDHSEMYIYNVNYDLKMLKGKGAAIFGDDVVYMVNPAFRAALTLD